MKTLLLMRHAKAADAKGGQPDTDRPLSAPGQRDAVRLGSWLRQQGLVPDLVISSSARRAAETAAAVIESSGCGGEWQATPSLYEAEAKAYFEVLRRVPAACATVLVVAHNPGIEGMVEALTGRTETMAMGAVAAVTLPIDRWDLLTDNVEGSLAQMGRPRELE
jgi:phosphohistidine phosphatase